MRKENKNKWFKRKYFHFKQWLKEYMWAILLFFIIFIFPIIANLFYKISFIKKLNVEGDWLQFYAVTFGLLITCIQYRNTKKEQVFLSQQALKPKLSLNLALDNDEINTKLEICNQTKNDYTITFIHHDYYDGSKRYLLNAEDTINIFIDAWADIYPEFLQIELKDSAGNNWIVGFEKEENIIKYYRSFIDQG